MTNKQEPSVDKVRYQIQKSLPASNTWEDIGYPYQEQRDAEFTFEVLEGAFPFYSYRIIKRQTVETVILKPR